MNKTNEIKKKSKSSSTNNSIRRGLRRSQRTVSFATKVTPEFDNLIREQAEQENCLLTEMLEKYQEFYLAKSNEDRKNNQIK
jgi:uncharacterized protein YqfB (UPF0267 family)